MNFELDGKWLANTVGAETHVTPIGDTQEHVETRQCWCRPFIEETGPAAIVVHHSFDGRELTEPDMRPEYQERVQ